MKENLNTGGKYSTAIFGKFSNAIDITSIEDSFQDTVEAFPSPHFVFGNLIL